MTSAILQVFLILLLFIKGENKEQNKFRRSNKKESEPIVDI